MFSVVQESAEHIFLACSFTKNIWRVIHFTFSITHPTTVTNLFGKWLNDIEKNTKARIRIVVCAIIWVI